MIDEDPSVVRLATDALARRVVLTLARPDAPEVERVDFAPEDGEDLARELGRACAACRDGRAFGSAVGLAPVGRERPAAPLAVHVPEGEEDTVQFRLVDLRRLERDLRYLANVAEGPIDGSAADVLSYVASGLAHAVGWFDALEEGIRAEVAARRKAAEDARRRSAEAAVGGDA